MDYMYTADINPAERVINTELECQECDYHDFDDVVASIGHSETTYHWVCPECQQRHFETIYNGKLFD